MLTSKSAYLQDGYEIEICDQVKEMLEELEDTSK